MEIVPVGMMKIRTCARCAEPRLNTCGTDGN